jgi:hypothetical protein
VTKGRELFRETVVCPHATAEDDRLGMMAHFLEVAVIESRITGRTSDAGAETAPLR